MNKGLITAYSAVAFAILAAAVLWFSISVSSEASRGTEEAERTFSWLSREASQNSYSLGFLTDAYIEKMTEVCRTTNTLSAMTISTPSGTIFAWPRESEVFVYSPNGDPLIQKDSFFTRIFNANIDMGANASPAIQITAAIRVLPPSVIFNASRNSFILIFLVLISSIVVILVTGKPQIESGRYADQGKDSSDPLNEDDFSFDFETEPLNGQDSETTFREPLFESSPEPEPDYSLEQESQDYIPENNIAADSGEEYGAPSFLQNEGTDKNDVIPQIQQEENNTQPLGLFSKTTGLGWQQYLEERLEAELVRAASFEQDVGLLIIRIFNLDRTDVVFRRIADILVETFKYRDMIFEYGNNACACIVPNSNLDETMQTADKLYSEVTDLIAQMQRKNKVCIGITTRTSRLLPASRMIEEADTATKKAEEEESLPIVAFRANPDKYRDYVVKNIGKADVPPAPITES